MKMESLEERKLRLVVGLFGCMKLIKNRTDVVFHVIVLDAGQSGEVLTMSFGIGGQQGTILVFGVFEALCMAGVE